MSVPLAFEPGAPAGAGELDALLQRAPALLRRLLDAVPARVAVLDPQERLVYANHDFFAFTRLHPKQVLGRHIAQIIGPQTHETYAPARRHLAGGETVGWEGWTELAGQGRRYMREHLVPCGPADDPTAWMVVISLDMTALKQREAELSAQVQALERTEALKSSIVDHALAALVSTDEHGRIVEFNPAAEAMLGHARDAVVGLPARDVLLPPRQRALHDAGLAPLADGRDGSLLGKRVELQALCADGREIAVEMVAWRTEVAGRSFYTASMVDLTERHEAAREIERQREALRQSEKLGAMGSLLAGVAHELNNPLSIVLGRASLLAEKADRTPLAGDARRIHEAAQRCGRIVRTFLNMARRRPAQRAPVQLNDIVRAAAEMLGYTLRAHGIALQLSLAESLPAVQADGDQIGQVVLNLVVNAQQALAAHDGERRIELLTGVEASRSGREPCVWLSVADSGPGVPAALRSTVFEPFFTTKGEVGGGTDGEAAGGTGLGLSVSRAIAREHGGELRLLEGAGGARFRLSLPVSGEAALAAAAAPVAAGDAVRALRVLAVDDEPEIAELMRELLEGAGYEVAVAESGAVALAMLDEARFDAVVSDLRMPDMDGAALWRAVSERHPRLARRMLFVTGDTLSPGARSFLEASGCTALDKPFSQPDLLDRVKALL